MMRDKIFQIVYCSRNSISGPPAQVEAEIESILDAARRNNPRVGVTGALFYNATFFAQVLEGGLLEVQRVFERLQLDPRHSDLVVLQSGFVQGRDFAHWAMAYAGAAADLALPFGDLLAEGTQVTADSDHGRNIVDLLREVVIKQENWALPERTSAVRPRSSAAVLAH